MPVVYVLIKIMETKKISLWQLFCACAKVGLILLGGGYVILPVMQSEFVDKRGWITYDELVKYYALSQSLPGLIAINTSIFVGYKIRGKFGALTSIIGLIFYAFWMIVCLASILTKLTTNSYVQGLLWGVGVAVIVLIIASIRDMWGKSMTSKFAYLVYIFALILMLTLKLSPALTIIVTVVVGLIYKTLEKKRGEKNDN